MRLPPIRIKTRLSSRALHGLYGELEPFVYAGFTGEPLTGVGVFPHASGHWHYVGFGLQDRFGHELAFRLAAKDIDDPSSSPGWPVRLLQAFAKHAVRSRVPLAPGGYLRLAEPVDPEDRWSGGALITDPELPGHLLVVGLRDDQLKLMAEDDYTAFLQRLREVDPLLVTTP